MKKALLVIALLITLVFTAGCTTQVAASTPANVTSSAKPATTTPSAKPSNTIKQFGEVAHYADGVDISVSEPAAFKATNLAAGVVPGQEQVVFTVILTNNTDEPVDPSSVDTSVSSDGTEARAIFDLSNPLGNVSNAPQTMVLPGKTIEWYAAFSVSSTKSLIFQITPGYAYKATLFTNQK